jgi:hypothetical protein
MTDSELLDRFENATLSGDEFPHREHVRVAWLYLRERPLLEVLGRFPRHLRALATALGAEGLYHETVTWFFLMLVHDRIARRGSCASWDEFARSNPDLLGDSATIMSGHYRPSTWQSRTAKSRFLLPDAGVPRS